MGLTATQKEVYAYCDKNDFVSADTIKEFKKRLEEEGNAKTLSYALDKLVTGACPNCNAAGAFKWHFLGKLSHPVCGSSWYVAPGTYMGRQMKGVFRTGIEIGGNIFEDSEKKGESGGCLGATFGFILGVCFRLPFALLMMPIQAIVSLCQKKPGSLS
ncbi:MAG: hypothetical protein KAQ81_14770 [Deltaproteobacteria bacterium]|nr:hypothetical protein [Deltaproteobacteria bacterium]